eukprot:9512751-Ditylum_brightwellii.AAC.1
MESGAHAWATAPCSNPGQSAHFSGGEEEVAQRASVLAASMRQELWLPAAGYEKGNSHSLAT